MVAYQTWMQDPYEYLGDMQYQMEKAGGKRAGYDDYNPNWRTNVDNNWDFWKTAAKDPTVYGATPLTQNIPTFEQWSAGNPDIAGSNSPEYQYLSQFYQLPVQKGDFFEQWAVPALMAATGAMAGGAFGPVGTGEFAGMGTFGGGAAGGASTLPESYWSMTADAGGAVTDAAAANAGTMGNIGSQQLIDGSMQSIFDAAANAGLPGYNAALTSGVAAGGAAGSTLAGMIPPASTGLLPSILKPINDALGTKLDGTDLARGVLGLGQAGLGYLGAGKMSDAISDSANQQTALAREFMDLGAPYRSLLQGSYQPGFSLADDPGYQDALKTSQDSFLRAASAGRAPGVSGGNPMGNPGAWAETLKHVNSSLALPYLQNYRGQLGQFGGLGLNTAGGLFGNAGQSQLMGAQAQGQGLNAIGYGLNTAFQQPSAADEYYKAMARRLNTGTPTNGILGLV